IGAEKSTKGQVKVDALRPSQALITVTLKKDRKVPSAEVVRVLQEKTKNLDLEGGRLDYVLAENEFAFAEGGSKPIMIEVKGYDYKPMTDLVNTIKTNIGNLKGVQNIQDDLGQTSPETRLNIDKRRAGLYGISALDVSLTAKAAIEG